MALIILVAFIAIACVLGMRKFVSNYTMKRQQALIDALHGSSAAKLLATERKIHDYKICYRDDNGDAQSITVRASNAVDARYNYVAETHNHVDSIESVKKL